MMVLTYTKVEVLNKKDTQDVYKQFFFNLRPQILKHVLVMLSETSKCFVARNSYSFNVIRCSLVNKQTVKDIAHLFPLTADFNLSDTFIVSYNYELCW